MDMMQIDTKQMDDIKDYLSKILKSISDISEISIKSDTISHVDEKFDDVITALNKLIDGLDKMSYTLSQFNDKLYNINSHLEKISYGIGDLDNKIHS